MTRRRKKRPVKNTGNEPWKVGAPKMFVKGMNERSLDYLSVECLILEKQVIQSGYQKEHA
jgi:hypothetical protein